MNTIVTRISAGLLLLVSAGAVVALKKAPAQTPPPKSQRIELLDNDAVEVWRSVIMRNAPVPCTTTTTRG